MLAQLSLDVTFFAKADSVAYGNWSDGTRRPPMWARDALSRMQTCVAMMHSMMKESLEHCTIDASLEAFDLEGYNIARTTAEKERLGSLFASLCRSKGWQAAETQFKVVKDVAIHHYKNALHHKKPDVLKRDFNHNMRMQAYGEAVAQHHLPVMNRALQFYFGFRRSTCCTERDINVVAHQAQGCCQLVRDLVVMRRYGPKKMSDSVTKHKINDSPDSDIFLKPMRPVVDSAENYADFYGNRFEVHTKQRKDKGEKHQKPEASRVSLQRKWGDSMDELLDVSGGAAAVSQASVFGNGVQDFKVDADHALSTVHFNTKFKECLRKFANWRRKRGVEDAVDHKQRYKFTGKEKAARAAAKRAKQVLVAATSKLCLTDEVRVYTLGGQSKQGRL